MGGYLSHKVLITGGAGFIGSHVADELLAHGYSVRVLDNLTPQVHGDVAQRPEYLHAEVELQVGDIRDAEALSRALVGVNAVIHLAAAVGVGQSMYEISRYTDTNALGTAHLLEALIEHPVERLVVASSMSIYGEGLYRTSDGVPVWDAERDLQRLKAGLWEPVDAAGRPLAPSPTPETKTPVLASVYALSKYDQERLCLMVGQAYAIPVVALRLFNVYGPRQALSNPYTGVLAIFAARLLNGNPPLVYEDGRQRRDFVSVFDVARAFRLALVEPAAVGHAINVGSGQNFSVCDLAEAIAHVLGKHDVSPQITGNYRLGDIRHCFADIRKAHQLLGYEPRVPLDVGLQQLAGWLKGQIARDTVTAAQAELVSRGLQG
ncbi:MAG: NAD-dependent epimerase/dehydratase family protein [Anaerolineae bacterium]